MRNGQIDLSRVYGAISNWLGGADAVRIDEPVQQKLSTADYDENIRKNLVSFTKQDPEYWSMGNTESNDSAHGLFQYPAMMVPSVQKKVIEIIVESSPNIGSLYDPFVGAGTTLTAGMRQGLTCYGQDINPLAILVSRVRTSKIENLEEIITQTIGYAKSDTSTRITCKFPNYAKWFSRSVSIALSRLYRAIKKVDDHSGRQFLWVVLAEVVRLTSNDRTSTYKLHVRSAKDLEKRKPDALVQFELIANKNYKILEDFWMNLPNCMEGISQKGANPVDVILADSGKIYPNETICDVDLLLTSPPYGDNSTTVPYGQHSYLPLQWIDWEDIDPSADRSLLDNTGKIDKFSLGGQQGKIDDRTKERLFDKSPTIKKTIENLKDQPSDRTKRILSFCNDLDQCLPPIISRLRPEAVLAFTIGNRTVGGNEVPNDRILTELLVENEVYKIHDLTRNISNKRMAKRNSVTSTMATEKISIYRLENSNG